MSELSNSQPSTEFGFARQDELDTVLRVMCAAFELPYEVARPIYYADPYFDAANKRVLRVNGQIVSCLTLTSARCQVGKAILPIAGIAGVATLPEQQRRGYAGQLITAALETIRERGYALAGLYPYDYAYYRRLGWETASIGCKYAVSPLALPAYSEIAGAHPDVPPHLGVSDGVQPVLPRHLYGLAGEHQTGIAQVYQECANKQALWGVRDAKRWQYVLDRVAHKYVYVNSTETVEGYLLYDIQPGSIQIGAMQKEQPPILNILELCAVTARARRGLMAHLSAQRQVGRIEYVTTRRHLERTGLLTLMDLPQPETPCAQIELLPALMLRVVNFARLLQTLSVNWHGFNGTILLSLRDDRLPQFSESVLIDGNGKGLPRVVSGEESSTPRDPDESEQAADNDPPLNRVDGDVRAWSQVVVGHLSGEDACALRRLKASTPYAGHLVDLLFPARCPFLPAPDHF